MLWPPFAACCWAPVAVAAGGPLSEPLDAELLPPMWRNLAHEGMMFPLDMKDLRVKIGPERQLLVDNYLIAEAADVTREVHQPERHPGNPLLTPAPGIPRSSAFLQQVRRFEEAPHFRMWYWASHAWHRRPNGQEVRFMIGYAISEDGIHWTRPELGLFEIEGSKENSIVIPQGMMHGLFYEPWDPEPGRRFKALVCVEGRNPTIPEGYYLYVSPDGIHWEGDLSRYVVPSLTGYTVPQSGAGDTSRFWWDPIRRKYRGDVKFVLPGKLRCRGTMESDDLIHWTRPHPTLFARDPDNQIYGHIGFAYEGMYLGFRWIYQPKYDPDTHAMEVELDASRDAYTWTRVGAGQPFMALNPHRDTWDASRLKPAAPLIVGDEIWIYYTSSPTARDLATPNFPDSQRVSNYSVGLAKLRLDGFASINGGEELGTLMTRPLDFLGRTLHVNAEVAPGGSLRVGLRTWEGQAVEGFDVADCRPVTGDGLDLPVSWNGGPDLGRFADSAVRLRFELHKAKLYSFRIGG